jgi:hypothetical protein
MQLIFVLLGADPRIIRSEASLRSTRASGGKGATGDAVGRSPIGGDRCRGERGVGADVP